MSGACGSRPNAKRDPSAASRPDAKAHTRRARGPGVQPAGTALTAPRVQDRAVGIRSGVGTDLTSGCPSSVSAISGVSPQSAIMSAIACARHGRSTTTDTRAPPPTITTWPGAANNPARSSTAGGVDSAEKKDN